MNTQKLFDLSGKVAIITGGSRGLGLEMATALAEAGAQVVITGRRTEWLDSAVAELKEGGYAALPVVCDVSNQEQVEKLVAQTVSSYGHIDILLNNAGISWGAPAEEMPLDRWQQVIQTNITGSFLCAQAAGKVMIKQGTGGKILNVSSIAGLRGTLPEIMNAVGYNSSKGAIIALTLDLAVEWARYKINVNAIAPGFFPTRMSQGIIAKNEETIVNRIPLKRLGGGDDIKGVALFLCSSAADYITGQTIVVDGGLTAC